MSTLVFEKEKGAFSRISEFLHNSIRKFSFQLMENNIWSVPGYLILLICEFVSQLFFPLEVCLGENYDSDEVEMGYKLMRNIQLDFYIRKMSSTGLIICISSLFLVFIAIMGYAIYKEYSTQSGQRDLEDLGAMQNYKIINFIIISFCCMLTIPIYICGLLIFRCEQTSSGYYLKNSDSIECGSIAHIIIGIISAFMILLFTIIIIIKELFMIDNYPDSKIPWAAFKITLFQLLKQFQKFLIVLFVIVEEYAQTYIFALVLYTLTILISCYLLMKNPPFYFLTVHSVSIIFQFILLIFSFLVFLVRLFDLELTLISIIIILIISIIFAILTIYIKQFRDYKILKYDFSGDMKLSLVNCYLVVLFIELKKYTLDISGINNEERIFGLFFSHQSMCLNPNCFCQTITMNKCSTKRKIEISASIRSGMSSRMSSGMSSGIFGMLSGSNFSKVDSSAAIANIASTKIMPSMLNITYTNNKQSNEKSILLFVEKQLAFLVSTYPYSSSIHMFKAFFSQMFKDYIYITVSELEYIKNSCNPNFQDLILSQKYLNIIEKNYILKLHDDEETAVDSLQLLEFEDLYLKIREGAIDCSLLKYQFWQYIAAKDFDANSISKIGTRLNEELIKMQHNFERAIDINYSHYNIFREYGMFLIKIGNKKMEGEDLLEKGRKLLKELLNQNYDENRVDILNIMSNKNTCIIIISGNPGTLGNVLSCNNEIFPNLGYQALDLINKNCSILMPKILAKNHNDFIQEFINTNTSTVVNRKKIVMAADVRGFIVPMRKYVKALDTFQDGIKFMAILRRLESGNRYFSDNLDEFLDENFGIIVTTLEDEIIGISEMCYKKLGIPPSFFVASEANKTMKINMLEIEEKEKSENSDIFLSESIKIQTIIPDLYDLDIEEEVSEEKGIILTLDTKTLKVYSGNENLTPEEMEGLNTRTSAFSIRMKSRIYSHLRRTISMKVYYFYLMPTKHLLRGITMNKEKNEKLSILTEDLEVEEKVTLGYLEKSEQLDKKLLNYSQLSDSESSSNASTFYPPFYFEFKEYKSHLLTKKFSPIIKFLKYLMAIIVLILLIFSLTSFIFSLLQKAHFTMGSKIIFNTALRHFTLPVLSAHLGSMKTVATTYTTPYDDPNYPGLESFTYSKELLNLTIDEERRSQAYIDSIQFDFQGRLKILEKDSIVDIELMTANRTKTYIKYTINTAFQQFLAKVSDLLTYSFERWKEEWPLRVTSPQPQKLERDYAYIFDNSLGSLNEKLDEAAVEFLHVIDEQNKDYWKKVSICSYISIICTFLALIIMYPNIVRVLSGKFTVLSLFAHIQENDSDNLSQKSFNYYKQINLKQIEKENIKDEESILPTTKKECLSNNLLLKSYMEEEKSPLTEEIQNESDQENDKLPKISDLVLEENIIQTEKNRVDIHRKEINLNKIKPNKLLLFISLFLVTIIMASYFGIMLYLTNKLITDANIANESLFKVGNYINLPLQIMLYLIYSIVYNRSFTRNGAETIDIYLENYLENKKYIDDLIYTEKSFLEKTQKTLNELNSGKCCDIIMENVLSLESKYKGYSFEGIKTLEKDVCLNIYNGLLTQGYDQVATTIYKESTLAQELRKAARVSGAAQSGAEGTQFTANIPVLNLYTLAILHGKLISPLTKELLEQLNDDYYHYLDAANLIFLILFILFIAILFLIALFVWPKYIKRVSSFKDILKLIKLIPEDILYKAYESKYQYHPATVISHLNQSSKVL